jgi:hypothetical protein
MIRSLCATVALLLASQAAGLKSVTDGCIHDTPNVVDACLMESDHAAVRCCDDSGSSCSSFCPDGANYLYNYTEAMNMCSYAGLRLCTRDELEARVCCGTGCSYDNHQTWYMNGECDEMDRRECEQDGNLEVLLPPLLDETETRVILTQTSSDMQVRLIVPKQYETIKVDFDGASDPSGALDSEDPDSFTYWEADFDSDPCNIIVTGTIPWDLFRSSLGGINEHRYPTAVWFDTVINIETTFELELKPETLLLEDGNTTVHQAQTHTRIVRTRIPFEIHFDLDLKLWASTEVVSDHLRVASALIDSSVLTVTPDELPLGKAQLGLVTVIPSPLILDSADIRVNDLDLAYDLSIHEVESKRDCVESEAFCTQYWLVWISPKKCDLNGQYVVTVYGVCNPDSTNCLHPSPNSTEIVMDVTSDDFCGVSQEVELEGSLHLHETECNKYMKGTVTASSPQGAAIQSTEIVELIVAPTLYGSTYLTVHDAANGISILNYQATLTQPNQVDFQFEWRGSELRCDVVADVDALVRVEFEATAPTLLEASFSRRPGRMALLDDEDMRMSESVAISAEPTTGGSSHTEPTTEPNNGTSAASSVTGLFGISAGVVSLLLAAVH